MINPQLLEYVRAQRSQSLSKEAIVKALAVGGWTYQDVEEAFMAIEGVQTPPKAPPPPPRTIIPPPVTPASIIVPTPTTRPVIAASEFSTAPVAKKRGWMGFSILLIFLLIVAGVTAWVYFNPSVITSYISK